MRGGLNLGKIFGIQIIIDWSWLFIFLLVTWNLVSVFSQTHPAWGGMNWVIAVAASLLFFASVLAHELAHSLMAIAQGLPVRNITLFLFGGVSNIERDPPSPRAEFLIAVVGPLTSIVLGVLFIFLARATMGPVDVTVQDPMQMLRQLSPLSTLLLWLGPINIILGIFNLIPGFPLDGGRILRSALWAGSNNLRWATRWAARVGQLIGWGLIVMGLAMAFGVQIPLFGTGLLAGLWLAFIGWFLISAANQSYRQVVIQDVLQDVPVSRLMLSEVATVSPDVPVSVLAYDHIMATNERAFPVESEGQLVGLVTLDDVRKVPRDAWERTPIREIMTLAGQLATIDPTDDASEAIRLLAEHEIRQLPVVREGNLAGLIRRDDVVRFLQMHSQLNE